MSSKGDANNATSSHLIDGRWYLATVATYFTGVAILQFTIPVTVQFRLGLGSQELGIAQAVLLLAIALCLLFGGRLVDAFDKRKILAGSFFVGAALPFGLAILVGLVGLSYSGLLAFLLAFGIVAGILNPSRDAILNQVAGTLDYKQLVAKAGAVQYGVAIFGYILAATIEWLEIIPILILHGCLMIVGGLAALKLRTALPPNPGKDTTQQYQRPSYSRVLNIPGLKTILCQVAILGAFGVGTFLVIIPLKIFDVFAMKATGLLAANVIFTVGTMIFSVVIIRSNVDLTKNNSLLMISAFAMAALIASIGVDLPFYGFLLCMFFWGGATALISISLRMRAQGLPYEDMRGRIMSLYNLAFICGTSIGAVVLGYAAERISLLAATTIGGVTAFAIFVASWLIQRRVLSG
tara:strand:+ start:29977 stop:31200 length:1224 start_codon:yes stop_codon:yes gene_type:complete